MIRSIIGGAVAAALLSGPAAAARNTPLAWLVTPTESGCRTDLDLAGRTGDVTPASLVSDGELLSLAFRRDGLPARAFLPIRIDGVRYSNLMLRGEDGAGELVLSAETEAALRRGKSLDIAWLSDEPLSVSLEGSGQGLEDLRVCGAQAAARHRERTAAEQAARDRAEAEARAKALNDAQLAAVEAQAAAAEAQRRQVEEAARRQRLAEAEAAERAYAEARQRAYEDERRQAYEAERRRAYERQLEEAEARRRWEAQRYWPPRYDDRY